MTPNDIATSISGIVQMGGGNITASTNFTYSFQSPDYVNKAREEGLKGDLVKRPNIAKVIARPPKC